MKKFQVWLAIAVLLIVLFKMFPLFNSDGEIVKNAESYLKENEQVRREIGVPKEIGMLKRRIVQPSIPVQSDMPSKAGYKELIFYVKGNDKNFLVTVKVQSEPSNEKIIKYSLISIELE